jgi:hypothetical protein
MDKTQILSLVQEKIKEGIITSDDLQKVMHEEQESKQAHVTKNITNIFYIIGALIILIGAVILTVQNWDDIGFIGRVLVTFGISLATYLPSLFLRDSINRILSQVLFLVSAILAPIGIVVLFSEFDMNFGSLEQTLSAAALCLIFSIAFFYTKRNILVIISMFFATWGYYALLGHLFSMTSDLTKLATMIFGVSYILLARYYQDRLTAVDSAERKERRSVENILYGIGTIGILAPAIFIGGIFDLLAIALIFAAFYASVFVKSKAMLIFAAIFLITYVIKITSDYFVNSVGWPLALIVIGFLIIGIGYGTLYLNRRYLTNKA